MSLPIYNEEIPFWYNVNFPTDLIFSGNTTRFLRVHFPDVWEDDLIEYYVTIIPIIQTQSDNSAYSINGINAKDLYEYYENNKITYDCLNVYGTNDISISTNLNTFEAPREELWQKVKKGGQFAWRLDYDASQDELLKVIILLGAYKPESNTFSFTGTIAPDSGINLTLPTGAPDTVLLNGIKGVNEWIVNDNIANREDIWKNILKFDFIETDIAGYACAKREGRQELNNLPLHDKVLYTDKSSACLMRTNPLLSGNVKLTADSNGDIWLNSIDANDQLSDSRFKKYSLSPNSSYAVDLYNFLDMGSVPTEILFDLKQYDNQYENIKNEYYLQYDNFYSYGVSQLTSKLYDEEFKFFAPLWLNSSVPEFFVIFRVDHPVSQAAYQGLSNEEITNELMKNAKIIKTFDLREGTKIGTYIRNITQHANFSTHPLYVSFDKDTMSTWTGVSYKDGVITDKGEFLYDVFEKDRTIKEMDEYLTEGFKRNGIICQNLINLEFLFDDDEADEYSINRYVGFYVNEIELEKFKVDKLILSTIKEQTPTARYGTDMEEYSTLTFNQSNDTGIIIPVLKDDKMIPLPAHIEDKNKVIVIKNREDDFTRIKSAEDDTLAYKNDIMSYRNYTLYDTTYNLGLLTGIKTLSSQTKATLGNESAAQTVLYLYDTLTDGYICNPGEELLITWERNGTFHKWKMIANETGLHTGDWWDFPVYNIDDFTYTNTFNPKGTPSEVAAAIAGCINQFDNREFDAVAIDNKIYIITKQKFNGGNSFVFTRDFEFLSQKDNILFYDLPVTYTTIGTPATYSASSNFVGGNTRNRNRAIVDYTDASNIENDDWFQTLSGTYSQVKLHNANSNSIIALPYLDDPIYKNNKLVGFERINDYKILEIADDTLEFYTGDDERIIAFKVFEPSFSILSFYPIQDFDFDFFYSDYAYTPSAELLRYFEEYEVQPLQTLEIEVNEFFKITQADGLINLEGYKNGVWETITQEYAYTILSSTPVSENLDIVINGTTGLSQFFANTDNDCLFNTYTPGTFHRILDAGETDAKIFRRYIFGQTYDKIRIVNNSTTTSLKFQKFMYMNKNAMYVDLPGSPSQEYTLIDKEHIDKDIQQFRGFAGLRDFLTLGDEATLNNLIDTEDFNRFFYGMLFTEYDRLKENYLKEWSLKSMVVPYVSKWVQEGTDIRDNKYRFNLSSAFGLTNFSPSFDIARDATVYSHEWFYLDEHPRSYPESLVANSRGYMFQSLNTIPDFEDNNKTWRELLYSVGADYFTKYFTIGYPHEIYNENAIPKKKFERYTFAHFIDGINEVYTTFHGAKIKISELDEFGEIIKDSEKYNDYKFSAIMTRRVRKPYEWNKLYDIEIIDNQKFKAITVILTVYLQDHKLFDDLSYTGLYTSKSAFKADSVRSLGDLTSADIEWEGFWSTSIDMQKNMNMGKFGVVLDYADVETQSTIFQDPTTGVSSRSIMRSLNELYDIEFPEFRRLNAGSLQSSYRTWTGIDDVPYSKIISFEGFANTYYSLYDPAYSREDTTGGSIVYHCRIQSSLLGSPSYPTNMYMHNMLAGSTMYNADSVQISYDLMPPTPLPITFQMLDFYNMYYDTLEEVNYAYAFVKNNYWLNTQCNGNGNVYYLNGGNDYNSEIIDKISFKSISDMINKNDLTNITYISIDENGNELSNRFRIEFLEYFKFTKNDIITAEVDTDRPTPFKTTETVGYDLKQNNDYEILYRYGGYFAPKRRNIIDYWTNERTEFSDYYGSDFILCNTRVATNLPMNGVIRNHAFNKVNETEILRIVDNKSYKSKYPLLNEVAIDKKDSFILLSNWDKGYFINNISLSQQESVDGMNELVESKAFMGSKVMNVPKTYEFHTFDSSEYSAVSKDFIAYNVSPLKDLSNKSAIDSGTPRIEITFDLTKRIIRDAIENNGTYELDWISTNVPNTVVSNMTTTEKENYIKKYIELNVLSLYTFDDITVYSKNAIKSSNGIPLDLSLTEAELLSTGYTEYKNIKVEKLTELKFKLTIFTDTKNYMIYSVGIGVKRI